MRPEWLLELLLLNDYPSCQYVHAERVPIHIALRASSVGGLRDRGDGAAATRPRPGSHRAESAGTGACGRATSS